MKKKYKMIILIIIGIISLTCTYAYAVEKIDSKEVSYDNTKSKGSSKDVQGSIDELYKKVRNITGEQDTLYKEDILNGADPVLGEGMIPVTIDKNGQVKYANLYTPWYKYKTKNWANAVILKSGSYKTGDIIDNKDIESYFVWIPKYSYKIWDLGNYTSYYQLGDLLDTKESAKDNPKALRHITGKARLIDIRFGSNENETAQEVGSYYTHPAFTSFGVKGLWVGKFETSKNGDNNIQVLPGVTSWRNETVGTFWNTLYNYKSISGNHNENLDPHMMKNTEWGSVAYLSHSIYGKGSEININNNSSYLTGYSAASNTDQSTYPGTYGTSADVTQAFNTPTGYLASTTGNITGIYDISGGALEYVAAYRKGQDSSISGITPEEKESKYFDVYEDSTWISYNKKILGDATGEMGPFYLYYDYDGNNAGKRIHNAWYSDASIFIDSGNPWFGRGGCYNVGVLASQFYFLRYTGNLASNLSSRLVLAVK